jgi:hypothetical protein
MSVVNKIDQAFLQSIAKLQAKALSATKELEEFEITDRCAQIDIDRGVKNILISGTKIEALFLDAGAGAHDSTDVSVVIKNCPNLKYVQLSDGASYHISVVSDKSVDPKGGNQEITTKQSDNPLCEALFINGVMKELFVMWGAAKKQEYRKDINNAVTRNSKLLPEEYIDDESWVQGGGEWKYDIFETFIVEPKIVYESGDIDSAFIGHSLSLFDFDNNYVDAVIIDESQSPRSNPSMRNNQKARISQATPIPSIWNVDFKTMYINHKTELANCEEIICGKDNRTLCVYNAPKLVKIVGNNSSSAKIDVGSCPSLKEITKCSIDYVGLNDMNLATSISKPTTIVLDGDINKFYAERFSVNIISCKSIQDYFIIGSEKPESPIPDIIAFEFTSNAPAKKRVRSNPKELVMSNASGYQSANEKIQSLFLNTKNRGEGFAIPPQNMDSIFYLVDGFYDDVYVPMAKNNGEEPVSYIEFMMPYIRGAGEAVTSSESKYSILFLQVLLTEIFKQHLDAGHDVDDVDSEIIDLIWDSRMKNLAFSLGKYSISDEGVVKHHNVEDCDAWVWQFDRIEPEGSLDGDQSVVEYMNAWLCDIAIYIYAMMFGSEHTQKMAARWAQKAIPKAYAPIQLYTIQAITGSNEARGIFLVGLIKLARASRQKDAIIAKMNEVILETLTQGMIEALTSGLPFSYTDIKLTFTGSEFGYQLKEHISIPEDRNYDLFTKTSSYTLMTKRINEGTQSGANYDFRFNNYMLYRFVEVIFLGMSKYPKSDRNIGQKAGYWTSLFRNDALRKEIMQHLIYDYLVKLPVDQYLIKLDTLISTWEDFGLMDDARYNRDQRVQFMGLTPQEYEIMVQAATDLKDISDSSTPLQKKVYRAKTQKR